MTSNHLFTSFLVAICFFIYKSLLKRVYKDDQKNTNKTNLQNSVIVFFITFGVLNMQCYLIDKNPEKTQVFTSEPNF